MKRISAALTALLAASAFTAPMAANAQSRHAQAQVHLQASSGWTAINARQASLERRIDQGVRNGALSRREAQSLRSQFQQLALLEARYRRGGLSTAERRDLEQRFNRLSANIRIERRDRDNRRG